MSFTRRQASGLLWQVARWHTTSSATAATAACPSSASALLLVCGAGSGGPQSWVAAAARRSSSSSSSSRSWRQGAAAAAAATSNAGWPGRRALATAAAGAGGPAKKTKGGGDDDDDAGAGAGAHGANVQELLDSMQAVKLRDSLQLAAETRPFMSYAELLDFIQSHGAADSRDEAHVRADALVAAGVVLRFNGVVYLKPEEVSELVYRTLPTNPDHARRNLADVEAELCALEPQHAALRRTAERWTRVWLYAGCAALTLQLVGMAYLTFWELSWDVMEPIAYMLSLTYSLLAYVYFLARGSYFEYGPFEEHWTQQRLEKKMAERGFDYQHFQHLCRARDRYRRYVSSADAKAAAAAAVARTGGAVGGTVGGLSAMAAGLGSKYKAA